MQKKKSFSLIEMMTVIMIIMLLLSLMIPIFTTLKMNARSSICRGQLRQIGVLVNAYVTDNNGYLPYKLANGSYSGDNGRSDIPKPSVGNNELYRYWNGHLLPYLHVYLPNKYTRYAMTTKMGCTRSSHTQLGGPVNAPPADPLKNGWIVVNDAFEKGGYQELRTFICPEIHGNTYDVSVALNYNDVRIPRISQLCNQGFQDQAGYDYGMNGGVPTTYLANAKFFGFESSINSYRIDQVAGVSSKVFHVEGGLARPGANGEVAPPYYMTNTYSPYTGGALIARFDKGSAEIHKLSFVHDNYDEFWIMSSQWWSYYFPSYWGTEPWKASIADKFNIAFKGKASMVLASSVWSIDTSIGYDIVSYVNPYVDGSTLAMGSIFDKFFTANNPGQALRPFVAFTNEPNEFKYLVGDMNVLFGDGSVMKKDAAWLCNNRLKTTIDTQE